MLGLELPVLVAVLAVEGLVASVEGLVASVEGLVASVAFVFNRVDDGVVLGLVFVVA